MDDKVLQGPCYPGYLCGSNAPGDPLICCAADTGQPIGAFEVARQRRLLKKRPIQRSMMRNPVSVVGGGATVGSGGTGSGVSQSSANNSFQRYYFNYQPWYGYGYGYGYNPWYSYAGYPWGGWNYGWPMGFGFSSPAYWPQWPQSYPYWPGPYAYAQQRYPVVAVA